MGLTREDEWARVRDAAMGASTLSARIYEAIPLAGVGTLTLDAGDPASIDLEYDGSLAAAFKDV